MQIDTASHETLRRRFLGRWGRVGYVIAAIALVVGTFVATLTIFGKLIIAQGPVVVLPPNSNTVLVQIQKMNRLETVSYSLERVYRYDQAANSPWYDVWKIFGDQRKLFVVPGKVIAGVDLTQLSEGDVQIQGKAITVNLPASQVLDTNLDQQNIQVYDISTGLAVLAQGMDPSVYNQILAASQASLKIDSCNGGILQQAAQNARQQFQSFLTELGFNSVTVNAPNGTC